MGASFAGVLSLAQHGEYRVEWSSSTSCVDRVGYAVTIVGTLGDGTSSGIMCTLGDGARIGDGVSFNDGASTLGGGARIVGGAALSAGAIGGNGGWVARMAALKRSASWRMARICAFPTERKGDAGAGLSSSSTSILVASAALSVEEVAGMMVLCRKKSSVRTMRSALVFVT